MRCDSGTAKPTESLADRSSTGCIEVVLASLNDCTTTTCRNIVVVCSASANNRSPISARACAIEDNVIFDERTAANPQYNLIRESQAIAVVANRTANCYHHNYYQRHSHHYYRHRSHCHCHLQRTQRHLDPLLVQRLT